MIPSKNDPKWKDLVTGKLNHQFKLPSAGMCITRNKRNYAMNNTPAQLEASVNDIVKFFQKYAAIMQDDINAIF